MGVSLGFLPIWQLTPSLPLHPDRPAARKALAAYVRRQGHETSHPHPINDDVAVKRYFSREGAMYSISQVKRTKRRPAR